MIVKFFKYGAGSAKSAFNYLLNDRVDNGSAKILRGSPALTMSIVKSLKTKKKYKGGCLSFEEKASDISMEVKSKIMDEFERVIFPGIAPENRNITWVEHSDKNGRLELNFVIPRVVFTKSKKYAYNPYFHRTDVKRFSFFRDYINKKYNFSNPLDKEKKQKFCIGDAVKNAKNEHIIKLYEYITHLIKKSLITNRDEVIRELEALGYEIKRMGAKYISIQSNEMKKAIRLKGVYYEENFSSDDDIASNNDKSSINIKILYTNLQKEIDKASKYYKNKFNLLKPSRHKIKPKNRSLKAMNPSI